MDPNNNPMKALTEELAEETKQRSEEGKGPNPVADSDLEIVTSKTTEGEDHADSMRGNEVRPGEVGGKS